MIQRFSLVLVAALAVVACGKKEEPKATAPAAAANAEEKVLNIYNWPDYIAKDLIANFEKDTGIKVNYQTFENNEGLQAKLVAGNTGYDIVVPGSVFVKAQIDAGLLKKLDKSQIPNYKNLDNNLMGKLVGVDPGNEHVIPWAWSFTTVAINKAKVAKALGSTPVSMPITEVYLALKTGQIDAQDNPTNMTRDWKFHEVTKQVVLTRHLVQPVFMAIAKPAFDKLTPAQQTELREASREFADMQIARTLADEKAAIDTFKAANIRISEPDATLFRAVVFKEYEAAGMTAKWKPGLLARVQAVQ